MGDNGTVVLIHIGVDTIQMNGDDFTTWTQAGDKVAAGEALASFDRAKVKAAGHPDIVPAPKETSNPQGAVDKCRAQFRRNGDCLSTALVHGAEKGFDVSFGAGHRDVCRHQP